MIEIESKSKNQRILDLVMVALAAISSVLLIATTDDILGDCLLMVVPMWITAILVFLRFWLSFYLCIAGIIVSVLALIFGQDYIVPSVSICAFCVVATIDMRIGTKQRDDVLEQKAEFERKRKSAVANEIERICKESAVDAEVRRSPYGDSIIVSFRDDITGAESLIERCSHVSGTERRSEFVVNGTYKETYTTTSRETLGKAVIKQDYTEVGRIDVKGDVERQHERDVRLRENFVSLRDAMRFAQSKSLNGDLSVCAEIWFKAESGGRDSIIATFNIAEFINGVRFQY